MLKHRILSGVLMTLFFGGLVVVDGWIDGSATLAADDDRAVQGTLLAILVAAVMAPATFEFAGLCAAKGLHVLLGPAIAGVVFSPRCGTGLSDRRASHICMPYVLVFSRWRGPAQYRQYGIEALANCGVNCLRSFSLGFWRPLWWEFGNGGLWRTRA
jgi:hypothetical protein